MNVDPSLLQRLGRLEFLARQAVEGFITGLHKSPFHGFSVEFAEHRLYNPASLRATSIGNFTAAPTNSSSSATRRRRTCGANSYSTAADPCGTHPKSHLTAPN